MMMLHVSLNKLTFYESLYKVRTSRVARILRTLFIKPLIQPEVKDTVHVNIAFCESQHKVSLNLL